MAVTLTQVHDSADQRTHHERRNRPVAEEEKGNERAAPCRDTRTRRRETLVVRERHRRQSVIAPLPIRQFGTT